jgi:hypothetical protein
MTTDWKRSNTGFIAIEASKQLKCITGLEMFGVLSSHGSVIKTNPAKNKHQLNHASVSFNAVSAYKLISLRLCSRTSGKQEMETFY